MDPYKGEIAYWEAITKTAEDAQSLYDYGRAEANYQRAIDHALRAFGEFHVTTGHSWLRFGDFLEDQSRFAESAQAYENAVRIYQNHGNLILVGLAMRNLAQVIASQGEHQRAAELHQQAATLLAEQIQNFL